MGTTYVPTPIQSGFRDTDAFDTELSAIAAELANKVDREGVAPNAMNAELDLGSNQMLNVSEGTLGTDGVNLNQVTNLATSIATNILNTGDPQNQTTGDPITFNFGVAAGSQGLNNRTEFDLFTLFAVESFIGLTVVVNGVVQIPGQSYSTSADTLVTFSESLNTDTDIMFIYGDLSPTPVFSNVSATLAETASTATAAQVIFTAPTYVIGQNQLIVTIDGVMQSLTSGDYTETTTTSITLDQAMSGGERINVREITGA